MAAPPSIEISPQLLRTLHRIHQQKADLEGQRRRGPLQCNALQATIDEAQAQLDAVTEKLKKTRLMSDDKHLQLQSREAHVANLQLKLNTAATNKEFQLLKDQIAADQQANAVQNDEIFEVLERIDVLESELTAARVTLAETKATAKKRQAEIEGRMAIVDDEINRINEQLVATETKIPAQVKADYDRIVAARGEEALAPIEQESCGNCYQTLTTQLMNQVVLSKLVHCPNCNSFLYQAEDRRVQ